MHVGPEGVDIGGKPVRGSAEPILVCGACVFGGFLSGLHYMLLWFWGRRARALAGDLVWVDTHSPALRTSTVDACVAHFLLYPLANIVFWVIYWMFLRNNADACADGSIMTVSCLFNEQETLYMLCYCVEFLLVCYVGFHWLFDALVVYRYAQTVNRMADFSMKWIFPMVLWCTLVMSGLVLLYLGPDPLI
jgi:hypothetical protein